MRCEECAQQTGASLMWLIYPLEFTPLNLFAVRNWFIHDFQLFPFSIRNWQNAATQSNYITHLLVFPFKWWVAKFFYQFDNTWNKNQNTVLFATKICHAMSDSTKEFLNLFPSRGAGWILMEGSVNLTDLIAAFEQNFFYSKYPLSWLHHKCVVCIINRVLSFSWSKQKLSSLSSIFFLEICSLELLSLSFYLSPISLLLRQRVALSTG